ncbi:hypothetical protein RF11_11176 [Thelohanellus kitauei]|uniref:Reverse transcriptase domain-containing protein n=1 Tax=Thelohanellus kitauei TaxID=669202 RepID=A0A0C2MKN8_THEKT|nr:hypothetical protein RF11_11176 [Thelohanellus kitauei]
MGKFRTIKDIVDKNPKLSKHSLAHLITFNLDNRIRNTNDSMWKEFENFYHTYKNSITIINADKGGGIVIFPNESYNEMGLDIIRRFKFTNIATGDIPSLIDDILFHRNYFTEQLNTLIVKEHEKINISDSWNLRYLYLLPKIHKGKQEWLSDKIPKGRPIISSHGSIFYHISKYIDSILTPFVFKQPHILKSTHQLVEQLKNIKYTEELEFMTADISELYLNIDIIELYFKCIDFLINNGLPPTSACLIADTLKFDLRHQLFTFNGELYSQTNGISMGAPYSPALANIYLLNFDLEVSSSPNVIFYRRYIDDVFLILKRNKPVPVSSLESLRLKFGEIQRGNVVTFLDLVIWNSEHSISYATHFKKLHAFNYIHAASWHSWATKKGMIHSQFMRIIKTNSNVDIRKFFIELLMRKFLICGYTAKCLKLILNRSLKIVETPGYRELKMQSNTKKRYRHILFHPSYDKINSKLQQLYLNENVKNKYNFSYYNPKCIRNLIKELHPGYREISKGIQRSNAHSWDINSDIGALQFYGMEKKYKPTKLR